jgi:hypothetical protein
MVPQHNRDGRMYFVNGIVILLLICTQFKDVALSY